MLTVGKTKRCGAGTDVLRGAGAPTARMFRFLFIAFWSLILFYLVLQRTGSQGNSAEPTSVFVACLPLVQSLGRAQT